MFGDYLINAKTKPKSSEEIDQLITGNQKLNEFLSGGFKRGLIYELQGQSLTGKSYFLNGLLYNNIPRERILFIDTNSSFCYDNLIGHKEYATFKTNIDHIENILDLKDLLNYFQELHRKAEIGSYSFIIIDSLSLIANKSSNKDDEIVKEFNNLILSVVSKFNVGFIYTSTCRLKDKILYDFKDLNIKTPLSKEMESNLLGNLIFLHDYTLYFVGGSYSFNLNGIKNRKYFIKIKKEKGHPIDILVEL